MRKGAGVWESVKVKIICVGKLKEKYLVAGIAEYLKRLQAYCKVEVYEVSDESIPDNCSLANEMIIKSKEGKKILDKIKQDDYVVLLDVAGKEIDSIMLAKQMENCMISGKSTIDFVIGGSLGHGQEIIERANFRLSFSKMTFPHQLMRLILVEQIYRAFKIMKNESYHK